MKKRPAAPKPHIKDHSPQAIRRPTPIVTPAPEPHASRSFSPTQSPRRFRHTRAVVTHRLCWATVSASLLEPWMHTYCSNTNASSLKTRLAVEMWTKSLGAPYRKVHVNTESSIRAGNLIQSGEQTHNDMVPPWTALPCFWL